MAWELPGDLVNGTTGLFQGIAEWAYRVTYGWFWSLLLAGFCVVLYLASSRYSTARALGYAGTAGIFGAVFLVTLNLMPWGTAAIFFVVGIILIVLLIIEKNRG